jgi:hypothetical protein
MRAFETLKAALEEDGILAGDAPLLADLAEGQTNLFEAVDVLLREDLNDRILLEGLKFTLAELEARRDRIELRTQHRRALLEQALMILERRTLERPAATITLAARPSALVVSDESLIPASFFKTKPVLDRKALKEALERGATPPGAHLSNGAMTLTIRRR